jgi:hypothetical protein
MRTKRKLAGWSRKELERNGLDQTDELVAAALAALMGKPAIYHLFVLMRENFGSKWINEWMVAGING